MTKYTLHTTINITTTEYKTGKREPLWTEHYYYPNPKGTYTDKDIKGRDSIMETPQQIDYYLNNREGF